MSFFYTHKIVGQNVLITPRTQRKRELDSSHYTLEQLRQGRTPDLYRYGSEVVWDIEIRNHIVGTARLNPNLTFSLGIYNAQRLQDLLTPLMAQYGVVENFDELERVEVRLEK